MGLCHFLLLHNYATCYITPPLAENRPKVASKRVQK